MVRNHGAGLDKGGGCDYSRLQSGHTVCVCVTTSRSVDRTGTRGYCMRGLGGLLAGVALLGFGLAPLAQAQDLPRTASGKPDMHGIWQAQTRAAHGLQDHAASDGILPAVGIVPGGSLPYQPWALARQQANFANRQSEDPLNDCFLPGVPRIMALDHPFQIVQEDDHVAQTFEWSQVFRLIYLSDEPSLYEGIESWMGHSRGHWEGDTLVVEVRDFNDRSWLDASGNFHSAAMTLTERYRMVDADTIRYEVTVTDPEVFTQPWQFAYNFKRQDQFPRLLEYQCEAEREEANGDFERDERTWYPAPIPADNAAFDADAGITLPAPEVVGGIRRLPDGTPDIGG